MNRLRWTLTAVAALLICPATDVRAQPGRMGGMCGGMGRQAQMYTPLPPQSVGFQSQYPVTILNQQPAAVNGTPSYGYPASYNNQQPSALANQATNPAISQDAQDGINALMNDLSASVRSGELTLAQASRLTQDVSYALGGGKSSRAAATRLKTDIKALSKYTKLTADNVKTITGDIEAIVPAARSKAAGAALATDRKAETMEDSKP